MIADEEPRTMRCTCGRYMRAKEYYTSDSPDSFATSWTCTDCPHKDPGDHGGFPEYG